MNSFFIGLLLMVVSFGGNPELGLESVALDGVTAPAEVVVVGRSNVAEAKANGISASSFDTFWAKFRTAVISRNKGQVADLAKFPMIDDGESDGTPFYRTDFLKEYDSFFSAEDRRCFEDGHFERRNSQAAYLICSNSNWERAYGFKKLQSGWKWVEFVSA